MNPLTTNGSMYPADLAEDKTAPAVQIETRGNYTRSPAVNLVRMKPLDQLAPVTEILTYL